MEKPGMEYLKISSSLLSHILGRIDDQFRVEHFLEEIFVIPVIGIKVLPTTKDYEEIKGLINSNNLLAVIDKSSDLHLLAFRV